MGLLLTMVMICSLASNHESGGHNPRALDVP